MMNENVARYINYFPCYHIHIHRASATSSAVHTCSIVHLYGWLQICSNKPKKCAIPQTISPTTNEQKFAFFRFVHSSDFIDTPLKIYMYKRVMLLTIVITTLTMMKDKDVNWLLASCVIKRFGFSLFLHRNSTNVWLKSLQNIGILDEERGQRSNEFNNAIFTVFIRSTVLHIVWYFMCFGAAVLVV